MDVHRVDQKVATQRRHLELWNMGNMDTGKVDAILDSNRGNRGIC